MGKTEVFRQIRLIVSLVFFGSILFTSLQANALDFQESPALQNMVSTGILPPVEKRLPQNPVLLQPVDEIGQYGGTWHMAMRRGRDHALMIRTIGYENLVRWTPEWTGIVSNVAQSYDVNKDATKFTFHLREGMRWSDGTPFNANDILFWYEDVLLNDALSEGLDVWRVSGGERFKVKMNGDYSVTFEFDTPHGLFMQSLAAPEGAEPTSYPSEYLKKFHIKYNPKANELATQEGYDSWVELFRAKFGNPGTIDDKTRWTQSQVPTLNAWILNGTYTIDEPLTASRNPYYWKIDPAGKQLPYIDEIYFEVVKGKPDARALARANKVDMQMRHMNKFGSEVYANPTKFSGLKTISAFNTDMNNAVISLNLNHTDPKVREIFQNKAFRVALSHGFNRQEIIDSKLNGQGSPFQAAPRPESVFYHKTLASQYLDYDVAKANRLLDSIGLEKRDSDGYRLRPDGKRLSFFMDTVGDTRFIIINAIASAWKKIGLDIKPRNLDRDVFYNQNAANTQDILVWGGEGGLDVMIAPLYYFPFTYESFYATKWALWFQNPQDIRAEEPPASIKKQMTLYRELTTKGNEQEQLHLMAQILDIAAENFLVIGTVLPTLEHGIMKNNFRNVPAIMPSGWSYPHPAPTNPAQYYIKQ